MATELGAEEQGRAEGITVRTGRLDAEEMTALLRNADLCVDATHPYATEATRNIRAAAGAAGVEYHRLLPILNYFATKLGQSMAGQGQ